MRILSRDFTPMEKGILLVLAIVLLGLAYYRLVDQPVREEKAEALAEQDALNLELTTVRAEVDRLRKMQAELDHTDKSVDYMASYNNSKQEISFLNSLLGSANDSFSVGFSNATRSNDQIRRNFTLDMTAPNFETVRNILYRLTHSRYRCVIGNLSYTELDGAVSVKTEGTFFETMVGGQPDIGLPADQQFAASLP